VQYGVLGSLGVGSTNKIFQNFLELPSIRRIEILDTAYCPIRCLQYFILPNTLPSIRRIPNMLPSIRRIGLQSSWYLLKLGRRYTVSSLLDTTYRLSEQ
ncbi:hypothetical protein Tco_0042862, partial [Tanacetum coccineum]